jgi:hypothetical protein
MGIMLLKKPFQQPLPRRRPPLVGWGTLRHRFQTLRGKEVLVIGKVKIGAVSVTGGKINQHYRRP